MKVSWNFQNRREKIPTGNGCAEGRAIKNLKSSRWQHPTVGRGWDMLWPESCRDFIIALCIAKGETENKRTVFHQSRSRSHHCTQHVAVRLITDINELMMTMTMMMITQEMERTCAIICFKSRQIIWIEPKILPLTFSSHRSNFQPSVSKSFEVKTQEKVNKNCTKVLCTFLK